MALRYGFFNSIDGDRKYDASDMSSIFDGVIEDGVFATIGKIFAVTPGSGLQILVDSGKAWFNHTWTTNDAQLPLSIDTPDVTLDRYDAVVLEVNTSEGVRANSIKIVKGQAASEPQKPALESSEFVKQYPLAYVTIQHGATYILPSNIEIMVGKSECPFVTGPLETVPIDDLFSRWESEFDAWFENVQSQLEGDIATNLQNQIDSIKNKETNEGVYYQEDEPYVRLVDSSGKELPMPKGWEVGDVRSTIRSDLDASWLLCNGDSVSRSEYPELSKLYDVDFNGEDYHKFIVQSSSFGTLAYKVLRFNNYYLALCLVRIASNTYELRLYYTTSDISGGWSYVTFWQTPSYGSFGFADMVCADGKIVIIGKTSDNKVQVAYSSSPTTPFTTKVLWENSAYPDYINAKRIKYLNGFFVAVGEKCNSNISSSGIIAYASSPDSEWATKILWTDANGHSTVSDIIYENGQYIAVGYGNITSGRCRVFGISERLDQEFEVVKCSDNGYYQYTDRLYYANGKYVVTNTDTETILVSTDIRGDWLSVNVFSDSGSITIYDLVFVNGLWVFCVWRNSGNDLACIYWGKELGDGLIVSSVDVLGAGDYGTAITSVFYEEDNKRYVYSGFHDNKKAAVGYIMADKMTLPKIASVSIEHSYIKVKE